MPAHLRLADEAPTWSDPIEGMTPFDEYLGFRCAGEGLRPDSTVDGNWHGVQCLRATGAWADPPNWPACVPSELLQILKNLCNTMIIYFIPSLYYCKKEKKTLTYT